MDLSPVIIEPPSHQREFLKNDLVGQGSKNTTFPQMETEYIEAALRLAQPPYKIKWRRGVPHRQEL